MILWKFHRSRSLRPKDTNHLQSQPRWDTEQRRLRMLRRRSRTWWLSMKEFKLEWMMSRIQTSWLLYMKNLTSWRMRLRRLRRKTDSWPSSRRNERLIWKSYFHKEHLLRCSRSMICRLRWQSQKTSFERNNKSFSMLIPCWNKFMSRNNSWKTKKISWEPLVKSMVWTLIQQMKRRNIRKLSNWRNRKCNMIDIFRLQRMQQKAWRRSFRSHLRLINLNWRSFKKRENNSKMNSMQSQKKLSKRTMKYLIFLRNLKRKKDRIENTKSINKRLNNNQTRLTWSLKPLRRLMKKRLKQQL